jgi:hypothetical protein
MLVVHPGKGDGSIFEVALLAVFLEWTSANNAKS